MIYKLKDFIESAITGLDAIQRAPIVNYQTELRCLRIGDISQKNKFIDWGYTSANAQEVRNFLILKSDNFIARTGSTIGCSFYAKDNLNSVFNNGIIRLRPNSSLIPQYLSYLLQTNGFLTFVRNVGMASATQPNIKIADMLDYELYVPGIKEQQHIVNTIGSVDDLIENLIKQNEKLMSIGLSTINKINKTTECNELLSICKLIKGYEVGSQKYIDSPTNKKAIRYLRVGDLLSLGSTFIEENRELVKCRDDDILIAFDGAPGRNAIGLEGAFSSGIYKIECDPKLKGLIYFEINSSLNQKIIKDYSHGTTILHASRAMQYLKTAITSNDNIFKLNELCNQIIFNKRKINLLSKEKQLLLSKYF